MFGLLLDVVAFLLVLVDGDRLALQFSDPLVDYAQDFLLVAGQVGEGLWMKLVGG